MSRRAKVLRGFGVLLALGFGAAGAWLVVTGKELRWVRLGALAELWAVLIGAFALFGARHHAPAAVIPTAPSDSSASDDEVERPSADPGTSTSDATGRPDAEEVAYDRRMEDILRRDLRAVLTRELTVLRAQVAALRSDVLERMTPDQAPAVASAIESFQRHLVELSHHDIGPADAPMSVTLPDRRPPQVEDPVPTFTPIFGADTPRGVSTRVEVGRRAPEAPPAAPDGPGAARYDTIGIIGGVPHDEPGPTAVERRAADESVGTTAADPAGAGVSDGYASDDPATLTVEPIASSVEPVEDDLAAGPEAAAGASRHRYDPPRRRRLLGRRRSR
ncbi:MAG: hypothetical protein ACTHMS_01260 [Jatrophihabitans sp.]|uniref:hypothetical protein n=1 Tax=Jatrophihabitans sp. TaxID=1932789 RepID=UPI003F7EDB1D